MRLNRLKRLLYWENFGKEILVAFCTMEILHLLPEPIENYFSGLLLLAAIVVVLANAISWMKD